jgi:hypothetical protein
MLKKIIDSLGFTFGLLIFELLVILICLFSLFASSIWLWFDQALDPHFQLFSLTLVILVGFLIVSIYTFILTLKLFLYKKKLSQSSLIKRFLIGGDSLLGVLIVGFFAFVMYGMFHESAPVLFPLNDQQATYLITKDADFYQIHYQTTSEMNKSYACTWEAGGAKSCQWTNNNDIQGYIGSSPVDLESYVGKNVAISGDFGYFKEQCIAKKCQTINSSFVGLEIKSIKEVQQ